MSVSGKPKTKQLPTSLSHDNDKMIFCNLTVFHSLNSIQEVNNNPKSDSVNKALVHNIKFMLKDKTSNGTGKYYPP
jgi:hypothetical protein